MIAVDPDDETVQPVRCTVREREVVQLVARGMTSREVGRSLGVSYKTISSHLNNLYSRNGISGGRVELTRRALLAGVVVSRLDVLEPLDRAEVTS